MTIVLDADNNLLWAPRDACTLPTADQPLRVAEFADLFAAAVRDVERMSPTLLRLELDGAHETTARELAAKEAGCCSFFTFTFAATEPDSVRMDIEVPAARAAVLDGLARQATGQN
ncbi:hypothetical protein [Nocardia sp. NPDC052566]|uniref:hypothetical protein n=1 Tax=Nocardia sp. NPDC052566 TaxID=3364330 RepID=UPI0037CC6137